MSQTMVNRFEVRRLAWAPHVRTEVAADGLAFWAGTHVLGVGRERAGQLMVTASADRLSPPALHAHHQGVELHLEDGLVGALGWLRLASGRWAGRAPPTGRWTAGPVRSRGGRGSLEAVRVRSAWIRSRALRATGAS